MFVYNRDMSAAFGLYRLQQIDTSIDQATTRLAAIRQVLESDADARQANDQLAAAQAKLQQAEQALRSCEADVKAQQVKIEQSEASLYGGTVHNPKELQDLQNEVAALKRHLARLEDRQLEAMLTCDEAEHEYRQAKISHETVMARLSVQNQDLTGEMTSLERTLESLQSERQAVAASIPEALLARYEELRQTRRGLALATVSDNACNACGTTLTPAQQQQARSPAQIALCPTCGRILYAG